MNLLFINYILILCSIITNVYAYEKPKCFKIFNVTNFDAGYFYIEESKTGFNIDLFNEIKKRSGCKFEELEAPRARIWEDLKNGRIDFATTALKTKEREEYSYFITIHMQKIMQSYVKN